jgi:methylmalonyl-CoA mutase
MARAIETGIPKMRIEEAAARKQARIDAGRDVIVGLNKYRLPQEDPIEILEVDNSAVREAQVRRLNQLRAERDNDRVARALAAITEGAEGNANLLQLAIEAVRARATVGEISDAMEKVFGRYKPEIHKITGIYAEEAGALDAVREAKEMVEQFQRDEGRRPRLLVAKLGQDGHDRGARVIATGFADIGFDVDIGPLFQTPEEVARQAVENDVHVVGVSSLAAGHKTLVPALVAALKEAGREDVLVVAGGVIPQQDYQSLYDAGCVAIFGPGTVVPDAAKQILKLLAQQAG